MKNNDFVPSQDQDHITPEGVLCLSFHVCPCRHSSRSEHEHRLHPVSNTDHDSHSCYAYSLPKESSEQKSIRATAIQKAAIGAATVPQDNAWRCYRVKELIILLKDKSNTNASSDLEIARLLSNTGLLGCILNIEVNLFLIKDENIKQKFQEQINQLRQYSQNIFSQR